MSPPPAPSRPSSIWPAWDLLFSRERLFFLQEGLILPLKSKGFLSGDAGAGVAAIRYLPLNQGVLVSRPGAITLHSHDLARELWRIECSESTDRILSDGRTALMGVDGFSAIDLEKGAIVSRGKRPDASTLVGFTDNTLLMYLTGVRELVAITRSTLAPLWRHPALSLQNTSFRERYLIQDKRGAFLRCLDAASGSTIWEIDFSDQRFVEKPKAREETLSIVQGFPSVVATGDRIVVVLNDARVVSIAADTGVLLSIERPSLNTPPGAVRPIHLITERSIFYLNAFGLIEVDHSSMKLVSRIDFRKEVEPLYTADRCAPYPCAFWISEESVVWTNMSGLLIGVSRKVDENGRRTVWTDSLAPGALVPVAQFPIAYGRYFYFSEFGDKKVGLRCYEGTQVDEPDRLRKT